MRKIDTFDISPDNHAFRVFNGDISDKIIAYHDVSAESVKQGFSGQSGSFNLCTFGECMGFIIEVWVAEISDPISVIPETLRAILLPFSVGKQGIIVGDFIAGVEVPVLIPEGNYVLLFELKLRDDVEYLNSLQYQENIDDGWTEECCRLTFYPRENAVQPEILQLDAWSAPPYFIHGYAPLNPTYPLVID